MKKAFTPLIVALTIVAPAACGGDDSDSGTTSNGGTTSSASAEDRGATITSSGGAFTFDMDKPHPGSAVYGSPPLEFEADPDGGLAYTADEVTAKDGNVTIEFTNPQSTPHNVAIEAGNGGQVVTETVSRGFDAVTITLDTKEKFIFFCTVPGHRKAGMEGVVKVDPQNS